MKVYIEITLANGRTFDITVDYADAAYVLDCLHDDYPDAEINYTEL